MRPTLIGILAAVFIALVPFFESQYLFYGAGNAKSFFIIGAIDIVLLVASWRLLTERHTLHADRRPFLWGLWLVILTQYLAAFLGVYPERSLWSDVLRSTGLFFLTHIALLAYVLGEFATARDWSLIRRAVALSSGLFAFLAILGRGGLGFSGKFLWIDFNVLGLTLGNDTFAGAYLLLALIVTAVELAHTKSPRMRVALGAAAAAIALSPLLINTGLLLGRDSLVQAVSEPSLLLGSARASSATMLLFVVYALGVWGVGKITAARVARMLRTVWSAVFGLGVCAGIALLLMPGSFVQEQYLKVAPPSRLVVWEGIGQSILERPWFGWGPENFHYPFEKYFDPALYSIEPIEIWFDKGHNVVIDTLVTSGVVGTAAFALLVLAYLFVVYRAVKRAHLSTLEASLLAALPLAHLLQLQTAFDTVGSYTLLGVIGGYVLWLERESIPEHSRKTIKLPGKLLGIKLGVIAVISIGLFFMYELPRQVALMNTFRAPKVSQQAVNLTRSYSRESDSEGRRLSLGSFIRGITIQAGKSADADAVVQKGKPLADIYMAKYSAYLAKEPEDYRARINYAYLLLMKTAWGEDHLEEAKEVIRGSYALSPRNPLTYALESLALLYGGDNEGALAKIKEAKALNPDAPFAQEVEGYLEKQIRRGPPIRPLTLENL